MHLSRDDIEAKIHDGEIVVIYHGRALKLNKWVERHPGGRKALYHMVGRDASDEMDMYHSEESLRMARTFSIGTVDMPWKSFVPPIQGGTFRSRQEMAEKVPRELVGEYHAQDENKKLNTEQAEVIDTIIQKELEFDQEKYPKVELATQAYIKDEFRQLYKTLEQEGWMQCNYWMYGREALRICVLATLSTVFYQFRKESLWFLALSGLFLGLTWHQLVFIAHDAGHLAITHNYYIDNILGALVANFIGGLSLGWWKNNHNVHHIVTNDPIHDPDIQHLPFFAVSSQFLGSVYSTFYEKVLTYDPLAKLVIQAQHYLYYPILCFGRFNLYRLSWVYLLLGQGPRQGKAAFLRWFEIIGLSFFSWWFFYLICTKSLDSAKERWIFILVSHFATMPVHVQITLSHFAQSTSNLGLDESFAQRQVRTTMDVACPAWLDYIHGGLQFQTIHHLFPRMPRHNFRGVQPQVIEFCQRLGLHYTIYGFAYGNKCIIDRLYDVAQQAAIFNTCNEFCRQEVVGGEAPHVQDAKREVMRAKSREAARWGRDPQSAPAPSKMDS